MTVIPSLISRPTSSNEIACITKISSGIPNGTINPAVSRMTIFASAWISFSQAAAPGLRT
ncbi:hypothetical protein GCM10025790_10700 [Nesterenkonia rhizosphaerae]|uniref:Uncharacterized protein n=1 Tax=Nesterenkonia rhizosphaerae TaxID=1348272 RepID=A0ABP9FTX5_9MICC